MLRTRNSSDAEWIVEPGGIRTEFVANVMAQVAGSGGMLDDEYKPILDKYLGAARNRQAASSAYQTADEAAVVVVSAIEAAEPPIRIRTSAWSEEFTRLKTMADPDGKKLQAEVIERFLS